MAERNKPRKVHKPNLLDRAENKIIASQAIAGTSLIADLVSTQVPNKTISGLLVLGAAAGAVATGGLLASAFKNMWRYTHPRQQRSEGAGIGSDGERSLTSFHRRNRMLGIGPNGRRQRRS